jgi:hypothetical protein
MRAIKGFGMIAVWLAVMFVVVTIGGALLVWIAY